VIAASAGVACVQLGSAYVQFSRLEGDFDAWRGKFLSVYPRVYWTACQTIAWDGGTLSFNVGTVGDLQVRLVDA
jgi:hypothetical protein